MLDRLPDAAAVYDRDHRLVTFNEAYRRHNAPIADMLSPGRSFRYAEVWQKKKKCLKI